MAVTTVIVLKVPNHGLSVGTQIFIEGVTGFNGALNNQTYTIINVTTNTIAIQANVLGSYQRGGNIHPYVSSISGPAYLNGQTVSVVANGQTTYSLLYNNGFTLPSPAWNIKFGLLYTWTHQFLPLGGDGQTVNQGKDRKLYDIVLRVWQSLGGFFGHDKNGLFPLPYDQSEDNVSPVGPLFTGDIHGVGFESQWDDYCMPVITGSQPFPFMLLAAIMRSEISEDK